MPLNDIIKDSIYLYEGTFIPFLVV